MLVTGATGFLGKHLVNGAATADWELIAPGSGSMDIRARDSTITTIRDWKPNVVVHLAYRKDRPTIVDGSRHVAEGAAAAGAHLVHMSTDVVFGGRAAPYTEADQPFPIIPYGEHKLDAERAVASAHPTAAIVRTSLLYGTDRPSPAQVELAAALRSPAARRGMTFFTDEFRCPAHADDVARAVADLAGRPDVVGPIHVAGPERVSRAQFASLMARHLGADAHLIPTGTIAESGQVRPANVVLDVSKAARLGITCRPVTAVLGSTV
ncbi:hypothetical protein YM304_10960 [Ilumatobacter coccineus YM16-304]|jgi:dTDP-4-dehydrorhamnose reductase|uniref:dTDP-4-dehydrorhamnose reductase n=2 Tax=Ilumatobacter coccineus TaxID=467094 RepID=A0A6C7E427_ILUCY|nr:hypothetical protein YM304_10960 [Ilumatobacter coccineus YM16-304]